MNSDSLLKDGEYGGDLRQPAIFIAEDIDSVSEDLSDAFLLILSRKVELHHRKGIRLNILLTEAEHDDWVEMLFHDKLDEFIKVGSFSQLLLVLFCC